MTIVSWEFESPPLHLFWVAEIAQLVEHNLAKVGVASSSLVFRSHAAKQPSPLVAGGRRDGCRAERNDLQAGTARKGRCRALGDNTERERRGGGIGRRATLRG